MDEDDKLNFYELMDEFQESMTVRTFNFSIKKDFSLEIL